jgi:hypothetical protein
VPVVSLHIFKMIRFCTFFYQCYPLLKDEGK